MPSFILPDEMADLAVRVRAASQSDAKFISDLIFEGIAPYEDHRLSESEQIDAVTRLIATTNAQIVTVDGRDVGYLAVRRAPDEIYVASLALLPEWRGQQLGTRLLNDLAAEADAAGLPLRLAVRESNPAARLYERLGFEPAKIEGTKIRMERSPRPDN